MKPFAPPVLTYSALMKAYNAIPKDNRLDRIYVSGDAPRGVCWQKGDRMIVSLADFFLVEKAMPRGATSSLSPARPLGARVLFVDNDPEAEREMLEWFGWSLLPPEDS